MSRYIYRKPVRRSRYSELRLYLLAVAVLIIVVGAAGLYILNNLRQKPPAPVSNAETSVVSDKKETFTGPYFQFQDNGKWSLDKNDSTANHFVYLKYRKNQLEHQMDIYVNQVPIPLNLATPRVLPVRIVNNNSFDVTSVSQPCSNQYAKGELHKIKELSVNNAVMLCDPDSSLYYVVLSEINGDYRLKLTRPNGTPIQFVMTYKELDLQPDPNSLINVAGSFKTL